MRTEFSAYAPVLRYVEDTWLVWKYRFVAAFLRNKRHYGHVTTSRVESAHSALKKWLSALTGNLLTVDAAVKLACDGQLAVIMQENSRQRDIANMHFGPLFSQVMGKISVAGLKLAYGAYKRRFDDGHRDTNHVICQGLIKSTMGHPCRHALLGRTEPFSVDNFDQHWRLVQSFRVIKRVNTPTLEEALSKFTSEYSIAGDHRKRVLLNYILKSPAGNTQEPDRVQTRGRPSGPTQRDPSHFEHVENSLIPQRRRRCRICTQEGHKSRTCNQGRARQPDQNSAIHRVVVVCITIP